MAVRRNVIVSQSLLPRKAPRQTGSMPKREADIPSGHVEQLLGTARRMRRWHRRRLPEVDRGALQSGLFAPIIPS